MSTPSTEQLTAEQRAYNIADSDLFQLAAYGHHTYNPDSHNDGTPRTTQEREQGLQDYRDRLRAAQARFEAAILMRAAAQFGRYDNQPADRLRAMATQILEEITPCEP
jgi:hypothetical protein